MFGRRKKAAPAPAEAYRTDFHTGLPELPDHYFWKIGPAEGYIYSWVDAYRGFGISIRSDLQRRPLYQSHEPIENDVELNVKLQAEELAKQFYTNRKNAADRAALMGEYPPKRMP